MELIILKKMEFYLEMRMKVIYKNKLKNDSLSREISQEQLYMMA